MLWLHSASIQYHTSAPWWSRPRRIRMLRSGLCSSGGTPSHSPCSPGWRHWVGVCPARRSPPPQSPARERSPQGRGPLNTGINLELSQQLRLIPYTPRKSLRSSKEANGAGPDLGCRDLYEVSVMTRLTHCLNTAGSNTYFGLSPLYSPLLAAVSNSSSSFIILCPHGSWLHCS